MLPNPAFHVDDMAQPLALATEHAFAIVAAVNNECPVIAHTPDQVPAWNYLSVEAEGGVIEVDVDMVTQHEAGKALADVKIGSRITKLMVQDQDT